MIRISFQAKYLRAFHFILFVLTSSGPLGLFAQDNGLTILPPENIRTIQFSGSKIGGQVPVIRLGEPLLLKFDDLDADFKNINYRIEHYDFEWKPSDLFPDEYLNGFAEGEILDRENSFNTLVAFTHYQLQLPNRNVSIKKSGNYLLKVFTSDPDDPLFTRKFVVYEALTNITAEVFRPSNISFRDTHQEIRFSIYHKDYTMPNPLEDLKVLIMQNGDWHTAITDLKPQFIRNQRIDFNYISKILFPGCYEFHNFDSKTAMIATLNINHVELDNIFNIYLKIDEPFEFSPYLRYFDVNGNFVIRNTEGKNSDLEADYTWVHFKLKREPLPKSDKLYIVGAFNNWATNYENQMSYNLDAEWYEASLLLKQGFYDYSYAVKNKRKKPMNRTAIDGSFYQTENDYQILVYYREIGERYDRVIGFSQVKSDVLRN